MISQTGQPKSGRFVLRIPPELHAALDDAARASGLSLNTYCVRHLATAGLGIVGDKDVTSLIGRARAVVGNALSGIVLHGSWIRGEATPSSDVDALIVVDSGTMLNRALYRAWDSAPIVTWRGHRLDPHFVHLPEDGEFSGLWAEVALDGMVLLDRDWKLSSHLARVRRAVAAGRVVRRVVHGHPYWKEADQDAE